MQSFSVSPVSIACGFKDRRCVVFREMGFLLKFANSFLACLTCEE